MKNLIFLFLNVLLCTSVTAQDYFQLADYNPGSSSTDFIVKIGEVDNKLLYSVFNDVDNESYVYVTNGTVAGTELLLTIPTSFGSYYFSQYQTDDAVYFRALGDVMKYDGSTLTTLIEDVYAVWMTELNGELYYIDQTADFDAYLAKATNDPMSPELIYNIGDPTMTGIAAYNGELYFFGEESNNEVFLYKSDGTEAGTETVYDLEINANSNKDPHFTVRNGFLYFFYQQSFNVGNNIEREFYRTDGTEAGTVILGSFMPGNVFNDYEPVMVWSNDVLYSLGINPNVQFDDGLWRSDGETTTGTYFVTDVNEAPTDVEIKSLVEYNGLTYFTAKDTDNQRKIFRTDGTAEGTYTILDDIFIGTYGSFLNVYDGNLVFGGNRSGEGRELWFSDGTEAGTFAATQEVANGNESFFTNDFIPFGNNLMFTGRGDTGEGSEVWIYNNGEVTPTISSDLSSTVCNDNGTPTGDTDDFIEITLNVTATGGADTYTLSSDAGTPSPATGTYGQATNFTFPAGSAGSGDIALTVNDSGNNSLSTTITIVDPGVCSTTAINNRDVKGSLNVVPNPFTNYTEFRLEGELDARNHIVRISAVNGHTITTLPFGNDGIATWKIENLASGVYFYHITAKGEDTPILTGRVVKIY